MSLFKRLISWYGKPVVFGTLGVAVALLGTGIFFIVSKDTATDALPTPKKQVSVRPAGELAQGTTFLKTIGTVRAVSEARLETEASGRVTAVNVALGDTVGAGAVLASIENSRERAALLQAEGAYEAAQASNAQSGLGLTEAIVDAQNTYRTAFTASDDIVRNLTDELFSNPNSRNPSMRIDSQGTAPALNAERVLLGDILTEWNAGVSTFTKPQTAETALARLDEAEQRLTRTSAFVSQLAGLVSEADADTEFTEDILSSYKTRLSGARSRIDATLQSITSARSTLKNAEQSVTGGMITSDSAARIKQALGSLRAAQSAYEKTLVRSPISGVINALYLKQNEFVGQSQPAVIIANNNALEITTAVSEEERALISAGDAVVINETIPGTITRIAPAVDPQTGKVEVKVSVTEKQVQTLTNGTTVSLSLSAEHTSKPSTTISLPLRALKITPQGPIAFTVSDTGTLQSVSVELGPITGDTVVIARGLDASTQIVTDARGLKDGESVEIISL